MELQETTGDPRADRTVRGLVGILERAFPDRIRGVYLRGSHASGTSVAGSDLDLFVVFKDAFAEGEARAAHEVCNDCGLLTPILLEVITVSERQLSDPEVFALAMNLRLATRLLHGDDIREQLPEFDVDAYTRAVVHTPYFSYKFPAQRRNLPALVYPLSHLDPDGEFYGFDQWLMPDANGVERPSTKLLIATAGWTATAIVVLRTGHYVADKAASTALYTEQVADEWTDLVRGVYEWCRNTWQYGIPTAAEDRRRLRSLCAEALAFQNHFLTLYRDFQARELASSDPDRRELAERRLEQIVFPEGV